MGENNSNAVQKHPLPADERTISPAEAEAILGELASVFLTRPNGSPAILTRALGERQQQTSADEIFPKPQEMYRVLVEQIPAVVFIAYLDRGIGEAYVSPQIEATLGFSQEEWLQEPIRWYEQVHPEDKQRWSVEAAQMLVTGDPLKSSYRVLARDGRVVWFRCEAKMVRKPDGSPWFLHGVGFDITELKQAEETLRLRTLALQNLSSRLLHIQDEQSRRIARELHDSLGQYLVACKMNVHQLGQYANGNMKSLCHESEELMERCIVEVRTLSHLLHPPLLDEIGLAAAAQWYVEGFAKRSGVKTSLNLPAGLERLPDAVEIALFRLLQEGLTNVHRHSGSQTADICLAMQDGTVSLEIKDQGRGIPVGLLERFQKTGSGTGIGLSGMRERAHEIGGRLEIHSGSGGTIVTATLPVRAPVTSNLAATSAIPEHTNRNAHREHDSLKE